MSKLFSKDVLALFITKDAQKNTVHKRVANITEIIVDIEAEPPLLID